MGSHTHNVNPVSQRYFLCCVHFKS